MNRTELYYKMLLIRQTEEKVEELFSKGLLRGTTHGSRGQEAIAVGLLKHIDCASDYITGGHRSHGHYLALNPDPYPFFAELMGKSTGLVQGRGGSQHLFYKNFYTNGITGGMVPVACGLAFKLKHFTNDRICVSFFGDGAMNEGYVMESFNLAAVFDLPILFVLENNKYAMSTSFDFANKGSIRKRVEGFGLQYRYQQALDVEEVYNLSSEMIKEIRVSRHPIFVEFETHRFSGHSKSDNREYIPLETDNFWQANDPLKLIESRISPEIVEQVKQEVNKVINQAVQRANSDV